MGRSAIDNVGTDGSLDCGGVSNYVAVLAFRAPALTDIDGKVQYVDENDGEKYDACLDSLGFYIRAENAQETSDNLFRPCQNHKGKNGCDSPSNYKRSPRKSRACGKDQPP